MAFQWSGGKDSALALQALLNDPAVDVVELLTLVRPDDQASLVHGVPLALLEEQAQSIGIPLRAISLPGSSWDNYLELMGELAARCREDGIDAFAFGDLQCSGIMDVKVEQFRPFGVGVIEPLWGLSSDECAARFVASGISATTIVVDAAQLGKEHVGQPLTADLIAALPATVDPCGELGEYHTFVYDAPYFDAPVEFELEAPHELEREINTTDGVQRFRYWIARPQPTRHRALVQSACR